MPYLAFTVLLAVIVVGVPFLDRVTDAPSEPPATVSQAVVPDAYGPRTVAIAGDRRGHFTVDAILNGRKVAMLADTGATTVVLTQEDARRTGFNPGGLDYSVPVSTANGTAYVAPIKVDRIEVDGIVVRDVGAFVASPGALTRSLLGMSFIGRLSRFSVEDNTLLLVE